MHLEMQTWQFYTIIWATQQQELKLAQKFANICIRTKAVYLNCYAVKHK